MSYQSVVLADNPAAFFLLNEAAGNFADSGTNAFTGTAHGTITRHVATGFPGAPNGVTFGAGGYISVPSAAPLNITGAISFEVCIGLSAAPGAFVYVASKGFDGTNGGYGFFINTTRVYTINQTGVGGVWTPAFAITADGTVRHYVFTVNPPNAVLYVNGTSVASTAGPLAGTPTSNTSEYEIGAGNDGGVGSHNFNGGTLAALSLYPVSLSAAQVTAHYNALVSSGGSSPKNPPGQVISALVHARNADRKADDGSTGQPRPSDDRHHDRSGYRRRRR